jgi:hypothetical protein
MVQYCLPTTNSSSENESIASGCGMDSPNNMMAGLEDSSQKPASEGQEIPIWVRQLQQYMFSHFNTQKQELLEVIQCQNEQIRQISAQVDASQTPASTVNPENPPHYPENVKRPRPKLPDTEKFTGDDPSLFPQFLGKLEAKLETDAASIGEGKDLLWYGFSRLEGKAAARIFPWMSTYKNTPEFALEKFFQQLKTAFQNPALKDKALTKLEGSNIKNKTAYIGLVQWSIIYN